MANKIIRTGGGEQSSASDAEKDLEVYRDVSMDAKFVRRVPETEEPGFFVNKLVNAQAVKNSLKQIFSWIPGERVLNPEFGNRLREYLYEGILDHNVEQIMAEIRHCFTAWEPRAVLQRVENAGTVDDTENNTVRLDVYYTIRGLDGEQYKYSYVWDAPASPE